MSDEVIIAEGSERRQDDRKTDSGRERGDGRKKNV
jgi:hypothetical protein